MEPRMSVLKAAASSLLLLRNASGATDLVQVQMQVQQAALACAARCTSTRLFSSGGNRDPRPQGPETAASPAAPAHAAPSSSSTSSSSSSSDTSTSPAEEIKVPGWLRGPQRRKTTVLQEEWVEDTDPATGQSTWRSILTGERTALGMPKPQTWHEVVDKHSGLLYYWCPETGDATTIGEPKPGPYGRHAVYTHKESVSASRDKKAGDKEEKPLTILSMYDNPMGYLLVGMGFVGIISSYVSSSTSS